MKNVGLVYDDIFLEHKTPPGHPESPERLISIIARLKNSGLWDSLIHIPPRKATHEQLAAVHTEAHIDKMSKLKGYADPDTYCSEKSYEAALYAAGSLCEAIDRIKSGAIDRAFCAVRPPGHHAEANRAMGFCLFNNIAVGARYAQSIGYGKIFIVDFDVHHGNGTQHIFEHDGSVFYFSTHQAHHYPGTGAFDEKGFGEGEGKTVNFPLNSGTGDREIFALYQEVLPSMIREFAPDMILVSAGYDLHRMDPLAGLRVTEEGIRHIIDGILSMEGVPAVFTLEGGYNLEAIADCVLITVERLMS